MRDKEDGKKDKKSNLAGFEDLGSREILKSLTLEDLYRIITNNNNTVTLDKKQHNTDNEDARAN